MSSALVIVRLLFKRGCRSMKRKTTLRDIGNRLGLSAMTVSLALRDNPRIPESTREKVRAAMRELR
ncbi:MAG: LacI family DNA-binding transcriptional regulator, partial [Acidobacteriota bacterium]